jgi:hypothetical protein
MRYLPASQHIFSKIYVKTGVYFELAFVLFCVVKKADTILFTIFRVNQFTIDNLQIYSIKDLLSFVFNVVAAIVFSNFNLTYLAAHSY